ncbi:MAG: hypothetical protein RLY14_2999 [Planctomycetota bacterium]|jgi:hypothetical protein
MCRLLLLAGVIIGLTMVGCSLNTSQFDLSRWKIKVVYQEQPLSEVQVVVYRKVGSQWGAVLEGVSGSDGIAPLRLVPTVTPPADQEWTSLRVTVESLAGGEWIVKPKWTVPELSELKVKSIDPTGFSVVELPKGAIGSL